MHGNVVICPSSMSVSHQAGIRTQYRRAYQWKACACVVVDMDARNYQQIPCSFRRSFHPSLSPLQMEDLGLCVKVLKHAPHRWLSLSKTFERVIRLWHPLKRLFINDGRMFPLEANGMKQKILELYSLMAPVAAIIRDGQHGKLPMNGEVHMQLSLLHVTLLAESQPLKVNGVLFWMRATRLEHDMKTDCISLSPRDQVLLGW